MSAQTMTRVSFFDPWVTQPTEAGIGAWMPLSADQQRGEACLDCGTYHHYPSRTIGRFDGGASAVVCTACYIERLRDHIDYYRPQS